MKLIYKIALRLSLLLLPLMAAWAVIFYLTTIREINDEADDALGNYSEMIMMRVLGGEPLPDRNDGSNNSWTITEVSDEYAGSHQAITYSDEEIYMPELRETEPARVLATIFPDSSGQWYELKVAMPTFEKHDLQANILRWVILLYLLLLIISIGTTLWVFRRSMQPLYSLLAWLDEYKPGKKTVPVPDDSDVSEFRRLSKAAQQAVDRFERMLEQQKQFIGNASHELQTPLAVLQGRLEYMVGSAGLSEEMLAEAAKMQDTISRIIRLNRTLLLLTKIENGQFPESRDIDIAALARELTGTFEEIYSEKHLSCTSVIPATFIARMNESLASVLVSNLLKNAWVHCPDNGRIEIRLENGVLDIANSGNGPLDPAHIFDRFYKDSGKKGSSGLGLALVKAIAEYYGMTVEYRFTDGMHHFATKF